MEDCCCLPPTPIAQAQVVRRSDNSIHWITLYPVDNAIRFAITYRLDSDFSVGWRYPPFVQLGPNVYR